MQYAKPLRGVNVFEIGLLLGIVNIRPTLLLAIQELESNMRLKFSLALPQWVTAGENLVTQLASGVVSTSNNVSWSGIASDIITSLNNGFTSYGPNLIATVQTLVTNISTQFTNISWYNLGSNIGQGIYNGLISQSSILSTLAWNTAVNMYNSARQALSIASPSKKFAWIGEMVAKGLGKGVTDNEDIATGAVADMANAMTDEAEKTNPAITIDTTIDNWITSLDAVLTAFSETIISRFDSLINTLVQLSSVSSIIPAVAQGRVIPSSASAMINSANDTANFNRMLESLASNQLTVDDLRPLLVEMFTQYMNLTWTVGDEQLARHVRNGNLLLDRRYSIIS